MSTESMGTNNVSCVFDGVWKEGTFAVLSMLEELQGP